MIRASVSGAGDNQFFKTKCNRTMIHFLPKFGAEDIVKGSAYAWNVFLVYTKYKPQNESYMGIVCIDERVWRRITQSIKMLAAQARQAEQKFEPKASEYWLDGHQVCNAFGITKRTLRSYRVKGLIPFSSLGGKYYYPKNDVARFLESKTLKKDG